MKLYLGLNLNLLRWRLAAWRGCGRWNLWLGPLEIGVRFGRFLNLEVWIA